MTSQPRISPRELLQHMQVPRLPGVYLLGSLERRVTVYSQQVRALNLVYALFEQGLLQVGSEVAVIGGGVAGLTAAAAAARRGCRVTVLEKAPALLHLFRGCDKRWLHPRIYDWPAPGSLNDEAGLPLLDWKAANAGSVAENLLAQWDKECSERIRVLTGVDVDEPVHADGALHLTWRPGHQFGDFQCVILAVGFGIERTFSPLPTHSYWHDDALDQSDHGAERSHLISGLGDGGLTDLLRACVRDFRHDEIVRDFDLDPEANRQARNLAEKLMAIEEEAIRLEQQKGEEAAAKHITTAYLQELDELAAFVDAKLETRLRGREVVLNGPGRHPLTRRASILNRFLVSRLIKQEAAHYQYGHIASIEKDAADAWQVVLDSGKSLPCDRIVIRHGTESALRASFPELWKACEKELGPRNVLDQTRNRLWPPDWFASTQPAPGRPRSASHAPASDAAQPAPYSPSNRAFYVPYAAKGEQLVGREGLLEQTRQQLEAGRRTYIGQTASFQGLGGLGKTQLAVEYAYHYGDAYPSGVIWIDADQDIDAQLVRIADKARWIAPSSEHKDKLDMALHRLRSYSECLIIFDNVTHLAAIKDYLPPPEVKPHILLTSRTEQRGFEPIPLLLLDGDQSLTMLVQEAGRSPDGQAEHEAARAIATRLDGLPLAIEIAGACLRYRKDLAWQEYRVMLDDGLSGTLPSNFDRVSLTGHEADLHATLRVSEQVLAVEPRLGEILDLLTWSASAAMGASLMATLLGIDKPEMLASARALGVDLRLIIAEPAPAGAPGEKRYRIHRLVQEVRRDEAPLSEPWAQRICQRLGAWFEQRCKDFADLPAFESEIDHLHAWYARAVEKAWPEEIQLTWLQGHPPFHHGRYREAYGWAQKALDLYVQSGMNDSILEANLRNDLGSTYTHLGEHSKAQAYYLRALEIHRDVLGEDHPDTAISLNNVGSNYRERGDHETALEHHLKALAICRKVLGEDHPDTATSLGNVGGSYGERGDHETALEHHLKALAIRRKVLGEDHPLSAISLNNVGFSYGKRGDHGAALAYKLEALAIRRKVLGEGHPNTATSLHNVGFSYSERGDHKAALVHANEALNIFHEVFGNQDSRTLTALQSVALYNAKLGKQLQAHELVNEHLRSLPKEHPSYADLARLREDLTPPGFRRPSRQKKRPKR